MKKMNCIFFCLIYLFSSCSSDERAYYESGELASISENEKLGCMQVSRFYITGKLKEKGKICDGVKSGMWQEFYKDGRIMWKGEYAFGHRQYRQVPVHSIKCEIRFLDGGKSLRTGEFSKFVLLSEQIHPDDMYVFCTNSECVVDSRNEGITYRIKPTGVESVTLRIKAPLLGPLVEIYSETFEVNGPQ